MKYWFLVLFVLGLGAILRLAPAMSRDFPINDGGMFYSMTKQLEKNNFALPKTAEYNHLKIAFAYPPLAFITAGLLDKYGKWDLLDIFRVLPAMMASLTLIPFYALARIILRSRGKALAALLAYCSLPSAYYTLIAGGGMTRSLGLLMALLALLFYIKNKYWQAGVLLAATFASHLEMSVFAVLGMAIFTNFYKIEFKNLVRTGILGILLSSWWWGSVIWMNGIAPFWAALGSNPIQPLSLLAFILVLFTREQITAVFTVLGLLGVFSMVAKKKWLVPAWLGALAITIWRGMETTALVPFSLAIGDYAIDYLRSMEKSAWAKRLAYGFIFIWIIPYIMCNSLVFGPGNDEWVETVSKPDREAMDWAIKNTGARDKFLIYTGWFQNSWASDGASEWFPTITGRESILTIQGTEWIKEEPWKRYLAQQAVHKCLIKNDCEIAAKLNYDYLYISNQEATGQNGTRVWPEADAYKRLGNSWELEYENEGVRIWRKNR